MFYEEVFKEVRKNKRWTIVDIAKACNATRQTVYHWEKGTHEPNEEVIRKLAKVLDIDVGEISDLKPEVLVSENNLESALKPLFEITNTTLKDRLGLRDDIINRVISQYNRMEQILAVLKTIMDSFESIFYVKDAKGKYLLANNAFKENLRIKSDFIVTGKTDIDFYSKIEAARIKEEDIYVIKHGEATKTESYILGSKKRKWGIINKTLIFDAEKKVLGLLCNITDITLQRKQQNALKFLLDKVYTHYNNMYYGIVSNDNDSNFSYFNADAFYNVLGIPKELNQSDAISYFLNNIIDPADREQQAEYYKSGNFPEERTFRIIHPTKGLRTIRSYTKKIMNTFLSYSIDITDQK